MSKECRSKKRHYTTAEQRVAAEILTKFMFCKDMDEMWGIWEEIYNQYELMRDPFTHTPCAKVDFTKLQEEYEGQLMERGFGG